eukprot:6193973-Pleurochrysis_carterae.AAC.4
MSTVQAHTKSCCARRTSVEATSISLFSMSERANRSAEAPMKLPVPPYCAADKLGQNWVFQPC